MVHRVINYVGAVPLDVDLLNTNKNLMIGLGFALQAILGGSTVVDGLACTPTGPASLQVLVAQGSIYSTVNVDGTAFGSLGSDTSHQILKQGITALGNTTFTCAAPSTSGQSIAYLIQGEYQDVDGGSTVLPYYNASNPAVAFNGPANAGTSQNTVRQGSLVLNLKAGTSATTGTQVTPTPDAGFTGLWVVTVANGITAITSGMIALYPGAPFINYKLPQLSPSSAGRTRLTGNTNYYVSSSGNDGNPGTSGSPWATRQHAYNWIQQNIDAAGFNITVNIVGTGFTDPVIMAGPIEGLTGPTGFIWLGNTGSPSSCTISTTGNTCFYGQYGAKCTVSGFTLSATGAHPNGCGILGHFPGTHIQYDHIAFGSCDTSHIEAVEYGEVRATTTITIVGAGGCHLKASIGGIAYEAIGETVTSSGTMTYTNAFASTTVGGLISARSNTYSGGTITGIPYIADTGVIDTNGGGASYFPGGGSSSTPNGGVYL